MLVLTRKLDEGIHIGNDVRIVVTGISRDRVRIGIEAPKDVLILRDELTTPKEETDNGNGK